MNGRRCPMGRKSNYENGMYQQLMEIMGRLDTVEKEHKQEVGELKAEIADLKEKNRLLHQENRLLKDDNARLKSIINHDSSNTSLPPSTDQKGGKPANTYNGRKKTKRKAGGQKGHKGTTLTKAEIEVKIASGKCRHEVKMIGNAAGNGELELSEGSVYGFCKKLASVSQTSISNLENGLLNHKVVATDATVVTVNGKQNYIRNFSIKNSVVYHAMDSKSIEALKGLYFLKHYTGILLHDHETALYHFGTDHAECNVHIIRYLRKNTEETGNAWSGEMSALLCEMNRERKELLGQGFPSFPPAILREYEEKYFSLIRKGEAENKTTRHKYAKKEEKTLLNRMDKYSHNHLLFLHDFSVPFDDNISERDLRKAKNRQKMAGGFRKESGSEMYCSIMTVIETLKKRKMGIIENIKMLFMGTPAIF